MTDNKRKTLVLGNKVDRSRISFHNRENNKNGYGSGDKETKNLLKDIVPFDKIHSLQERQTQTKTKGIRNLDVKVVKENVKKEEEEKKEETPERLSVYQILVQENRKKEEEKERIRQIEVARKEEFRKKKQEEQLKRFNSRNKNEEVTPANRTNNNRSDGGNDNYGNGRNFKSRTFGNGGRGTFFDKNEHKGGRYTDNRNNKDNRAGGSGNFDKKRTFPNRGGILEPTGPVFSNSNTKSGKKDYKKTDNDNYEENKKSKGKKIAYISSNDDNSVGRRKKTNFFKSKERGDSKTQDKIIHDIELHEFVSVGDLADKMGEKRTDVVKKLISMGMLVTVNQTIDADTAEMVVMEFGHSVKKRTTEHDIVDKLDAEEGKEFVSRAPVVTIMGHVDHGKTSLLDAIRTTKIAEGEAGGITQHIGASRIEAKKGKFITFIDTPGHEAFTEMRMRGANITDIVVLVVAADDGVKEQTIEAINHAKSAKVPIVLAINKIDKAGANPQRVKQELLQYDIVCEEFGGDVIPVEVSAKEHIGLDKLKETILLQAEVLNLKAPIDVKASGVVIESRMEQNKGAVATLLVQKGVLKEGDLILAGMTVGRIKKMVDSNRKAQKEARPSVAVEVLGLSDVPVAGDQFNEIENDKEAREIVAYRERKELENKVAKRSIRSLDSMLKSVGGKSAKQFPVIIKADVNGSIEAIIGTLTKLNTEEIEIDVIHSATGAINTTDINLATVSNAVILGFNVRASNSVIELAKSKNIDIRYYSIIYNIVDDMKLILSGMLAPVIREEITGHAEIRQVFKITGAGNIAGSFVLDGEILRSNKVRLVRDGVVIYTGEIGTLKRFKDDVKEVKQGFECGISIEGYNDIKEKDLIEGFKLIEEKREL
ncbi:MAG: translation initiation factor IF-2 [Rickettsiales bacterium]|jgi:translation initiation factor IF-2|nr:translation initiation factor IF-2 [Rickettsiales bacterium]